MIKARPFSPGERTLFQSKEQQSHTLRREEIFDLPPRRPTMAKASRACLFGGRCRPVQSRKSLLSLQPLIGKPNKAFKKTIHECQLSTSRNEGAKNLSSWIAEIISIFLLRLREKSPQSLCKRRLTFDLGLPLPLLPWWPVAAELLRSPSIISMGDSTFGSALSIPSSWRVNLNVLLKLM
jgi:hypothetical protein